MIRVETIDYEDGRHEVYLVENPIQLYISDMDESEKQKLFNEIRPKGHWIRWYEIEKLKGSEAHIPHCKCSNCNLEYDPYISRFMKYCSNCGYKMESSDDSN